MFGPATLLILSLLLLVSWLAHQTPLFLLALALLAIDANSQCRSWSKVVSGRVIEVGLYGGTVFPSPPTQSAGCGTSHTTTYSYDAASRLTSVSDPLGAQTSITSDLLGRKVWLSDPDMGAWGYGYDLNSNLTTQIDARGQVTLYAYDALNRLTGVGTPGPTHVSAAAINTLRTQVNTDRTTNGLSAQTWQSPTGTLSPSTVIGAATANDLLAALAAIPAYASSLPSTFTAGAIAGPGARPVRVADLVDLNLWTTGVFASSWTPTLTYTFDTGTGSYLKGRRASMTDQAGSSTYTYDWRGCTTSTATTRSKTGHTYSTYVGYNDADQPTTLTYPDTASELTSTTYNARGLPTSLYGYISGVTYDPLGRPTSTSYADTSHSSFTYDPTSTRLSAFSAPGFSRSYGYDAVGNLTCRDPAGYLPCTPNGSGVDNLGYDAENRVISLSGLSVGDPGAYTYDAVGDLTTKNEANATASLAYGAVGTRPIHAPTSVTANGANLAYHYDAAGNLTSRGTTSYAYDWQNHLTQVSQTSGTTQFVDDGDGALAERIDPSGAITDYVGNLYERVNTTSTETKRYYLGQSLIGITAGGGFSYLHARSPPTCRKPARKDSERRWFGRV